MIDKSVCEIRESCEINMIHILKYKRNRVTVLVYIYFPRLYFYFKILNCFF